jgi:hypothetical protein
MAAGEQKWKAYDVSDLREMKGPDWLIQDVLPMRSTVLLYAKSGVGKSFVILDAALCVATDADWHGHQTREGVVVYVALEQPRGYGLRLKAWETRNGWRVPDGRFHLISAAVDLQDSVEVEAFITHLRASYGDVALVVFDTLSKSMPHAKDENSNAEMSSAVAGAERIAQDLGACVVLVHHTGKDGQRSRGGYALDCNSDVRIKVEGARALAAGCAITLKNEKQKDADEFSPITLRAELVTLDGGESSLALVQEGTARKRTPRKDTARQKARVIDLRGRGYSYAEIEARTGVKEVTARSWVNRAGVKVAA